MYFHEKSVIISLFLVRFQIRLNHMKDLLILHVTKEKNIKKVLYRCCKIAKRWLFLVSGNLLSTSNVNNSKSISRRTIRDSSVRSWRRRLQIAIKNNKIWLSVCGRSPRAHARTRARTVTDMKIFVFWSLCCTLRTCSKIPFRSWSRCLSFDIFKNWIGPSVCGRSPRTRSRTCYGHKSFCQNLLRPKKYRNVFYF